MNYTVFVNNENIEIKTTHIFPTPYNEVQVSEYTQFTMKEPVDLRIQSETPLQSVIIRPLSLGLDYSFNEHEIFLHLEEPKKFSVEINGSFHNNLIVFAEAIKYEDFNKYADNVIYYEPGIHTVDVLKFEKDNTIIYLEEGAFLNGKMEFNQCSHLTICGYGTISMEKYPLEMRNVYQRCIDVLHCKAVSIRDITITDSNDWSLRIFGCDNVTIDNVKIFGCRGNSDGIDICGSRNVLVQNIFTRVWDDSFVVKAFNTGDVDNVTFKDSVLWNDFARPLEVGVELRAEKIHNVRFENIDIIHSPTGYPLMGIHHGDRAEVSDICFENIRIENAPGAQLFDIRIRDSVWNRDKEKGSIKDITFKDIYYIGNPGIDWLLSKSRLQGFNEETRISNITFDNINILGKVATNEKECGLLTMEYVDNVIFKYPEDTPKIQAIDSKLTITENFHLTGKGCYQGKLKVELKNTGEKPQKNSFWLQISPAHTGEYNREPQAFVLEAGENISYEYQVELPPGKYVLAVQAEDVDVSFDWQFLNLDWMLSETEKVEETPELEFINYYNIRTRGLKASTFKGKLLLQSDILKDSDNSLVIYTALPVPKREEEVLFSVEETDFGVVPAVLNGKQGLELAPQLRCPLEITLVFKNEPKVKEIKRIQIPGGGDGFASISFEELGLEAGTNNFWLEIEAQTTQVEKYRYPYTLFHSVTPLTSAHMFANVVVKY
ncbi:glycosyl hydrolase family 28 protein [Clostridium sp. KNHs205]|uniref:glycosyl hydrolase family 28 protein n=1 Tax=Clostridium sp. KNHs205 TaxID=1449050 RepID=UPI00051B032A|nr:glycosyl hydrolase family 28 protein [Clostridium sp. KNHs205]